MYMPQSDEKYIDDACLRIFSKGMKELEKLPPTQESLKLHIKWVFYTGICVVPIPPPSTSVAIIS
jgi:hypothetical protein